MEVTYYLRVIARGDAVEVARLKEEVMSRVRATRIPYTSSPYELDDLPKLFDAKLEFNSATETALVRAILENITSDVAQFSVELGVTFR